MARLVAVCREGEDDYPFLARQIPLYVEDVLTMVMEFSDRVVEVHSQDNHTAHWKQFSEHFSRLSKQDLNVAMLVTSGEVYSALSQLVPCVGCRRSVERLLSHLVESGKPALDPLTVKPTGTLSVTSACLTNVKKLYALLYVQGSKLNEMIDSIPKSKKNKRCQLHSLDTHKPKPFGGSWMDVWERMSQECRDEVVVIDSTCLLETLETYLRKHRFCTDCKNKVLRAYNILVGEVESSKEKGYCTTLFEGLCCCPHQRHIHVCCETDFIGQLLSRAEPEFTGGYERRERHAKTIDVAQEEVLTCLGIHLYERLHKIWQRLRAEEQTWQILFHLGVDALRKRFEMAVEKMQGFSRLEQLVEELSEEERAKELKQERKRLKKKNRRKNKCGFDMPGHEIEENGNISVECSLESMEGSCKACGSRDEEEEVGCEERIAANESTTCNCQDGEKKDLSTHSNSSDCGYSSSVEGSEMGSREGSDVACSEGICNHDEAGDDPNLCCVELKEHVGTDCLVDCWTHSEESVQCQSKTKKKKGTSFRSEQLQYVSNPDLEKWIALCQASDLSNFGVPPEDLGPDGIALKVTEACKAPDHNKGPKGGGCMSDESQGRSATTHSCRTKEIFSSICGDKLASMALRLPRTAHLKQLIGHVRPPEANLSLEELLEDSEVASDEDNCLTQDEIQAFLESNQSFYNNRHQYRQLLKEKFTNYCRSTEQNQPVCGEWLPTSVS